MTILSTDIAGNKIIRIENGIYLQLISEKRKRLMGVLVPWTEFFIIDRQEKHLLRKADAYGFNYELLRMSKKHRTIILNIPEGTFHVPMDEILKEGSFLWFKAQGFERQIFFTLKQLEPFMIK